MIHRNLNKTDAISATAEDISESLGIDLDEFIPDESAEDMIEKANESVTDNNSKEPVGFVVGSPVLQLVPSVITPPSL